jgi:hypothetical protein
MRIQFQLKALVFCAVQAAVVVHAEELCTLTDCQDSQKIKKNSNGKNQGREGPQFFEYFVEVLL